jgi:hypothetical protein
MSEGNLRTALHRKGLTVWRRRPLDGKKLGNRYEVGSEQPFCARILRIAYYLSQKDD